MFDMAIVVSEWPASTGFDPIKAAQIVAFFVQKQGGAIEKLKLVKLIYLSERLSFERRSAPMNFDDFYSMPHGPVPSSALNLINGKGEAAGKSVTLKGVNVTVESDIGSDHLSRNDISILEKVWADFGAMSAVQIRNWTHKNCPEYVELQNGRLSISYDEILEAVGAEDANSVTRELKFLQREIGRLPRSNDA